MPCHAPQAGVADVSPMELRRALENSATRVESYDPWAQVTPRFRAQSLEQQLRSEPGSADQIRSDQIRSDQIGLLLSLSRLIC